MKARTEGHNRHIKSVLLLGSSMLAASAALAPALAQDQAVESVTVTGYQASLENSINAKRQSLSFTDSVFAEDIGKFPDNNLAESLNRSGPMPGASVTASRPATGVTSMPATWISVRAG